MISVLILTLNEEINLPGCLESVSWSDDVVVFDSYSDDSTVGIAEEAGAKVFQRRFDNYASQRNAAFTDVDYKYPWILMLDADERATPEMVEELKTIVARGATPVSLYRLRRKDMFMGKWLRRSSGYPTWFGRFFRVGEVRVEREINEEYHTDGEIGFLTGHLLHFPFNKGISYWFERHNRYSSMEAATLAAETRESLPWNLLFSRDPAERRKIFKQIVYRLPGRPVLIFMYLYFFRLGLLDGFPGFTFCVLRMIYEFMIDVKIRELRRRRQGLPV